MRGAFGERVSSSFDLLLLVEAGAVETGAARAGVGAAAAAAVVVPSG